MKTTKKDRKRELLRDRIEVGKQIDCPLYIKGNCVKMGHTQKSSGDLSCQHHVGY